jgi:5-methylcytosine-specific restriction endonuclease McrA
MTWDNHGMGPDTWQIDHIVPIKYPGKDGGVPTLEEVAERLHWTNCQPLWTADNIAKGNRFIGRERPQAVVPATESPKLSDTDIDELLAGLTL